MDHGGSPEPTPKRVGRSFNVRRPSWSLHLLDELRRPPVHLTRVRGRGPGPAEEVPLKLAHRLGRLGPVVAVLRTAITDPRQVPLELRDDPRQRGAIDAAVDLPFIVVALLQPPARDAVEEA